jgi:hypothetical protein
VPDLDAGARKEPKQTSGAPYPRANPTSDGPEREARAVPTREELEAQGEPTNDPAPDEEQR